MNNPKAIRQRLREHALGLPEAHEDFPYRIVAPQRLADQLDDRTG